MALPTLETEIDFTGNPTATYYDTLTNTDGIVSYWRMADAATLTDALGANSGTVVGTPSLVSGALPYDTNQALSFNGSSQRAYVPSSSSLTPTNMTVQGWVKMSGWSGNKDLVAKHGTWKVWADAGGLARFTVKNDTASISLQSYNTVLTDGAYHLLTAVHDSTNGMVYFYVDGVLDQSAVWAGGREGTSRPIYFAATPSSAIASYLSSQTATGTSTSLTVNAPVSIAAGDLLIAQTEWNGAAVTDTPPTGWILLAAYDLTGTGRRTRIYYKVATGSEPASYTWTLSSSSNWLGAVSRFTGVDAIYPFANNAYGNYDPTNTLLTMATGSHLPSLDNVHVVALFSADRQTTFTEDAGTTERYDFNDGGNNTGTLAMSSVGQATAASINVTGTAANSSMLSATMLVLAGSGINSHTLAVEDEWSFWNIALTADQVAAQYQARLSGVGAWVNVGESGSGDARSAQTKISRQYELNKMEAGTASVPLRNIHRRYDPANTSSIYWPNVKPNRKMLIRALLGGVYYPIFQGFIERWPSNWEVPNYDEVTVTLADGFKGLSFAGVSGTLDSGLSGGQINTILNKALWPVADRAIDTGLFTMAAKTFATTDLALAELQDIADSELGIFFMAPNGQATFHDRSHRWTQTNSITSQATFSDAGNFIPYTGLVPSDDDDTTVNNWLVQTAAGATSTAQDVISAAENWRRTQTRTTRLDNPGDAATQAVALLQIASKPSFRLDSLTLKLTDATPTSVIQKALTLAISDKVTVVRNPVPLAGGSTISRDFFIEGIAWNITPKLWTVSYQLSPVSTATYYDTVMRDTPVSYWRFDSVT